MYHVAMPAAPAVFRDKSVLVTGASSGIGEELAWQLGQAGAKLTLCARRLDRLESLAQKIAAVPGASRPVISECDVARDGDLERAVGEAIATWGKLDVAIANAGFGIAAPLKKLRTEDYRRQFETNVFGVLRTVYAALPELEKSRGNLALVGSVAGWVSSPGASPYSMSKFAVRALAEDLHDELESQGVGVTLLSPGFVVSDIGRVDNQGVRHEEDGARVPAWIRMPTDEAARQIVAAIETRKREAVITGHGRLGVFLYRHAPWLVQAAIRAGARRHAKRAT